MTDVVAVNNDAVVNNNEQPAVCTRAAVVIDNDAILNDAEEQVVSMPDAVAIENDAVANNTEQPAVCTPAAVAIDNEAILSDTEQQAVSIPDALAVDNHAIAKSTSENGDHEGKMAVEPVIQQLHLSCEEVSYSEQLFQNIDTSDDELPSPSATSVSITPNNLSPACDTGAIMKTPTTKRIKRLYNMSSERSNMAFIKGTPTKRRSYCCGTRPRNGNIYSLQSNIQ